MDEPRDFKTNYGRPLPPLETRWKPGQSGNPRGRPKKGESIVDLLQELVDAVCPTDPERRSYAGLLKRSLLQMGLRGNLGAIREVCNRLVGQAPFLVERIGAVPYEPNRQSGGGGSTQSGSRVKLTLEEKNKILEILEMEPISDQSDAPADNE